MFGIINNLIGLAVLVGFVYAMDWSWWYSIPVGIVLMTVVTVILGMVKARVTAPKPA